MDRNKYAAFLKGEYAAASGDFLRLIRTSAIELKARGDIFVGKFLGYHNDSALFRVRRSEQMPRSNSFWTGVCLTDEMGDFHNWGDRSWLELRKGYLGGYSEALCTFVDYKVDPEYALVGINRLDLDFGRLLEEQHPVIAFGPHDPPLEYLTNLSKIAAERSSDDANRYLDLVPPPLSLWAPTKVASSEELTPLLFEGLKEDDTVAVQGPPGTGKSYRIASLVSTLLEERRSVLATALTHEALMVIACFEQLAPMLAEHRVSKTGLRVEESKKVPGLQANDKGACNPSPGHLSLATFYVASRWAADAKWPVFDYVVMDEASQAYLPMIAAAKRLGRYLVLVGDQQQLSPIVRSNTDEVTQRGWWPIVKGFDTVCNSMPLPTFMLTDTYRLTERAARFTGMFYGDALRSLAAEQHLPQSLPPFDTGGGPVWLRLSLPVGDKKPEAALQAIEDIAVALAEHHPSATVAVLAKFVESVRTLQRRLLSHPVLSKRASKLRIETVDRIQGLTVDYTLFLIPNTSVGFSLEREFFNVATSRSRLGTLIVADSSILNGHMDATVRRFLEALP